MSDSIKVVCRLRPLNKIEIANSGQECVTYSEKDISIAVGGEQTKYSFAFDKVFGPGTQQVNIYREVAGPIIKSVISGFNGTIFAYGQTGGGKTWTMQGPNHHDQEFKGLIPRTIQGLFQSIGECEQSLQFVIKSSYIEIYNQKLFDLLDPSKARLQIKQDKQRGVFIQNCTEISVSSAEQMLKTMDSGSQNRKVAFTGMNQRSSRSHSLFIIHLYQKNLKKDSSKQSKLYFVDLAGSQKVGKTGVVGQQLQQAKNINKSLSALGNVINALTSQKKQHVPYRDSKLTRILQESLGGNSRTTLIINCSMCTYNDKETLSTLRFGYRAKSIKNKPKVNEQKSVKELLILLQAANKTIAQLKVQLKLPIDSSLVKGQEEEDERDQIMADLKSEIQSNKKDEQQRSKQMQTRIKQLLLELSKQKQDKGICQTKWVGTFLKFREFILKINKFVRRSYVDLEFCLNNIILGGNTQKITTQNSKQTIQNTLKNIQQFECFYKTDLFPIFSEVAQNQKQQQQQEIQDIKNHLMTPDKRKSKMALSQPTLHFKSDEQFNTEKNKLKQDSIDNMSCIVPNLQPSFQENNSDKISQSECSQIQTILQSLETKQSHRIAIQQMAMNLKEMKKQNEELNKKLQKMIEERQTLAKKMQQKYEQRMIQLEERAHQYKSVLHQKDIELTKYFQDAEKVKKSQMQDRIVSDRLKKIIETSANMKSVQQLEEKVRSLANERQKIFNQLYILREQLDDAQTSVKQKDEHIQSLKAVMKQLNESAANSSTPQQITKSYKAQVFGTETPNVVQTVKGGGLSKQAKKSSLRKKTQGSSNVIPFNEEQKTTNSQRKQSKDIKEIKEYLPFFKSFFN